MAKYYLIARAKGAFVYRAHQTGRVPVPGGWTVLKREARFWDKEYKAERLREQLDKRGNMEVVDEAGLKLILEEMDRREIQKALMR